MSDRDEKDDVRSKIDYPSRWGSASRKERSERKKPIFFVLWLMIAMMVTLDAMSGFQLLTWRDRLFFVPLFITAGFLTGVFQMLWSHLRFEWIIRKNRGRRPDRDQRS